MKIKRTQTSTKKKFHSLYHNKLMRKFFSSQFSLFLIFFNISDLNYFHPNNIMMMMIEAANKISNPYNMCLIWDFCCCCCCFVLFSSDISSERFLLACSRCCFTSKFLWKQPEKNKWPRAIKLNHLMMILMMIMNCIIIIIVVVVVVVNDNDGWILFLFFSFEKNNGGWK